jgi:hypothetical protein
MNPGRRPLSLCTPSHRHLVHIRPAGPARTWVSRWWIRDYGCDVTYLQPDPHPRPLGRPSKETR